MRAVSYDFYEADSFDFDESRIDAPAIVIVNGDEDQGIVEVR